MSDPINDSEFSEQQFKEIASAVMDKTLKNVANIMQLFRDPKKLEAVSKKISNEALENISSLLTEILQQMNISQEFESQWKHFSEEIKFKNRFTIENDFANYLLNRIKETDKYIEEGKTLYRARNNFTSPVLDMHLDINDKLLTMGDIRAIKDIQNKIDSNKEFDNPDLSLYKQCQTSGFWGYDQAKSGAPEKEEATAGRMNPSGIAYLYVANSPETALAEVRPMISDYVSIAKLKTKRKLKIADLTRLNAPLDNLDVFFRRLSLKFSRPINRDEANYLPTQYLAEKIKNADYAGIKFASSLHKDGYNIVFFDPNICEVLSSEVYEVKEIAYSAKKVLPSKH